MTRDGAASHALVSAVAHHEAGHALAIVWSFRNAAWLPKPPPRLLVRHVEITEDSAGQWSGSCVGMSIYSTGWSSKRVSEPYRDLMERQVVIELAGGVAEAIYRGERRRQEVLRFATRHCCIDTDLTRARAVLGDLRRLTGVRYDEQPFAERALTLMLANWRPVEALAQALIADRRIEGERVQWIIDHATPETAMSW